MFSVELKKQAIKFLKFLDKSSMQRITDKIDELEKDPFPHGVERVEGFKDVKVFRVRVGNYRILYFVDYSTSKVYIEKIDKRSRVY